MGFHTTRNEFYQVNKLRGQSENKLILSLWPLRHVCVRVCLLKA